MLDIVKRWNALVFTQGIVLIIFCFGIFRYTSLSTYILNPSPPRPLDIMLVLLYEEHDSHWADAYVLLQSIMTYRTCPISFHVVTDVPGRRFFESDFYELSHYNDVHVSVIHPNMSSFPSIHTEFKGGKVMFKAFPDFLLPSSIEKLVVIDLDMTVVDDICQVWKEFDAFDESTILGLAPEQSDFYEVHRLHHISFPIPAERQAAPGRNGVNSGFIVMDLHKSRKYELSKKMITHTQEYQRNGGQLPMGDQDVYNLFTRQHPEILRLLSSAWNQQLNAFGVDFDQSENIRVLHANGGTKESNRNYLMDFWMNFAHPKLERFGIQVTGNYSSEEIMKQRLLLRDAHVAQFVREENYQQLKRDAIAKFTRRTRP